MPKYLEDKKIVCDIFNGKSETEKINHYYKYMIVYNKSAINDEKTFIKLLNRDFEYKEGKTLTVDDTLERHLLLKDS